LVEKEFEVGSVLTSTMKIRRKHAYEFYKKEIDELYKGKD
jgi:long-subunit acyl-CoA synthetase (AMP-forming)